ncbi:MAG: transglutaminase domain-containing protein [Erysipelotrichales bacterium]|nr:transglutaminase domain-containing protein [Erysipelotrichales bacterium]
MKEKKYKVLNIILFFFVILLINVALVFVNLRDKFKSVTIEVGTEKISVKTFIVSKLYNKRSKVLTNLDSIDLNEVGEYDIELIYGNVKSTVKLSVVDTTAPEVEFQDLVVGLDYEYNKDDFVVLVKDYSDYEITSDIEELDIKLGEYKININVTDVYGNTTSKQCFLNVKLVNDEITHELGEVLTKEEILISENFGSKELTKEVLGSVNINEPGEHEVKFTYDGKTYKTKVTVKDTKGPKIVFNNITFYLGSKNKKTKEDFVKSVTDPSGVKEVTYDGELKFDALGVYELKIRAVDNLGNVSEEVATLTVKDDDIGPVISGLSTITINKGESIDYLKGVKSVDAKDGNCEITVDTSKVITNAFGTYYATYTSKDMSNNVTTKKRTIVVRHDADDTEKLFDEYFNKYLVGKSVLQIVKYIRNNISYVHNRGDDPVYIAIVNRKGSCYGHAIMVKKALDKLGIENVMVYTKDETHYWNLVKENGVWRHYDATPGSHIIGPATDAQKLSSAGLRGRSWDKSLFPAAN